MDGVARTADSLRVIQTATERAYQMILDAIADGVYGSGQPLREEDLAEQVGVSRTPVREALRRLDAEGLVELLPNRGARVSAWDSHELDEIFDLRVQLESHGARLAAVNATPGQLEEMADLCASMEQTVRAARRDAGRPALIEQITELNNRFHKAIVTASGNRRLGAVLPAVVQRALVARTFRVYRPDQLQRSLAHHRELLEALTERDPDWAEAIMRAHIFAGRRAAQRSR